MLTIIHSASHTTFVVVCVSTRIGMSLSSCVLLLCWKIKLTCLNYILKMLHRERCKKKEKKKCTSPSSLVCHDNSSHKGLNITGKLVYCLSLAFVQENLFVFNFCLYTRVGKRRYYFAVLCVDCLVWFIYICISFYSSYAFLRGATKVLQK